jgi:DNA-binding response OmpR family regulator
MRILLATEEPLLAELIAFRLELLGHVVDSVHAATQAHAALDTNEYSLLILDTALPGTNVRESLTKIRGRWSKDLLPILVISMDQSLEQVEHVYRCGADDYLLAPFDPQSLQSKLDRLLFYRGKDSPSNSVATKRKGWWR